MDPITAMALISAGGGLLRNIFAMQGGERSTWGLGDIQRMISNMRQAGYSRIGRQVAGGKQAAAGQLAASGLGDSSMVQAALGQVGAGGVSALADLEASLSQEQMRMVQNLMAMQQQERMWKQQQMADIFGGISDIGLSYFIGQYFPRTQVNMNNPYQQFMPTDINDLIQNQQTLWNYQSIG